MTRASGDRSTWPSPVIGDDSAFVTTGWKRNNRQEGDGDASRPPSLIGEAAHKPATAGLLRRRCRCWVRGHSTIALAHAP